MWFLEWLAGLFIERCVFERSCWIGILNFPFVEHTCGEGDIVFTRSRRCMCAHALMLECVHASSWFVSAITSAILKFHSSKTFKSSSVIYLTKLEGCPGTTCLWCWFLPDMPISGSSNSAPDKTMMSKIWTNWDTIIWWSRNFEGKGEIACYEQFLLFPQCFQKLSVVDASKWISME